MSFFKHKFSSTEHYLVNGDPLVILNRFIDRQREKMKIEILMAVAGRDSIVITTQETNNIIREHIVNIRNTIGRSEYFKFITQEYFGNDKAIMHYMTEELFTAYNMIHAENAAKRRALSDKSCAELE